MTKSRWCGISAGGRAAFAVTAVALIWGGEFFVASAAIAAGVTPADAALTPSGAPQRRAGWWEFRTGLDRNSEVQERMCIGARSEKVFSAFDQLAPKDWCSVSDFHRDGDHWAFKTVCEYGVRGMTTVVKTIAVGTIKGDLTSDYVVHQKITSQQTDRKGHSKQPGTREGDLQARWAGPCPAGKNDGDRVLGFRHHYTINVLK